MGHETITDDLLGTLTWDFGPHEWKGRGLTAGGLDFDLSIDTGACDMVPPIDDAKVPRTLSAASRHAFIRFRDTEPQARALLVDEFVPLFADWHGEEISPALFQSRLLLNSVQIFENGSMEIFYGDDGMFGGHSLIVHLNASGAFERGEMFG